MFMKKIMALTLSALLAISILASCSDNSTKETTKTSEAATQSQKETTPSNSETTSTDTTSAENSQGSDLSGKISFSVWDLDSQMSYIHDLVKAFNMEYPQVEVEIMNTPSADYTTKLELSLNGGSAADVFLIKDADTSFSLNQKGQLTDLTDKIAADNIDLSAFNGLAQNFNFDGVQVGLPFRTDYYILYYNKAIFDAAEVEYPTNDMTWDDFEALAKKVTSGEGAQKIYGAHLHTWQAIVQNWAVQDGKNTIMGPDYEFMTPYYEMALRMQNDDKTIQDFATLKTANIHYSSPFQTGQVAMLPMGSWFMSNMIDKVKSGETTVDWGIATIPHPKGLDAGNTIGSSTPIAINPKTKNMDAAWAFATFATGEKGAEVLANAGQFPARIHDDLLATITALEGMPEGAATALQVKNIILDRPIVEFVSEVNTMLGEEHGLIMLGESSISDGLKAMSEATKDIQSLS